VFIPTVAVTLAQGQPAAATIPRSAPAPIVKAVDEPRDFLMVRALTAPIRPVNHVGRKARPTKPTKSMATKTKAATPRTARREEVAPPPSGDRAAVLAFALAQVGKPYRRGGSGTGGWDCSGLVSAAYRSAGVSLPHSSGAIGREGRAVPAGQWRPGDVIASRGHVALYLGNGLMVEAANPHAGVRVTRVRPGTARRF
jgi:cell wall-associated NlpC family hydrolase